jgi:SWI/SNF-related matrix-associated actin-dependent regulator of chromatin subfamily A3
MEVFKTNFYFDKNINITNENTKILSYNNYYIYLNIVDGAKSLFHKVNLDSVLEKFVFYEIINNSPLWSYNIEKLQPYGYSHPRYTINVSLDLNLVQKYLGSSLGLSLLLASEYNNLKRFIKFDDERSFVPSKGKVKIPKTMKVKLYDYQINSLHKMIEMENNEIKFNIEYTTKINLKNTIELNYDPIKKLHSPKQRFFKILSRGGILADEMGLGKTITTIGLIIANPSTDRNKLKFSESEKYWKLNSKATVIVCPSHITKQWEEEARRCNPSLNILSIVTKKDHEKLFFKDFIDADIIITSHQFLMNFKYYIEINYRNVTPSTYNNDHRNKTLKDFYTKNINNSETMDDDIYQVVRCLELPLFEFFNFHRLILDEGHEIFGEMLSNTSLSRFMATWLSNINANNYWYISGSPFVNFRGLINCVSYLNLRLVDEDLNFEINKDSFNNGEFFSDITNKNYLWDNVLEKICIRHKKEDVTNQINIKGFEEVIEWVELTELERNIYNGKKNKITKEGLQQLCCHPLNLDSCRKIMGDIKMSLSEMQTKLIEYHQNNVTDYTKKIERLDDKNQAYHMLKKSYETIISESKYMLQMLNKLTDDTVANDEDKVCIVCFETNDLSITSCGHIFCEPCIKNWMALHNNCPMCKKNIKMTDVYLLNKKDKVILTDINPLIEKYGSKLGKIITMVRSIILEPESRIIIFSQWDFMLSLIGKSLSENGIANSFVKGNVWARNSAINKFKNGKTLSGEDNKVIMASLKNSASGTNLTETTHIFFVEPINSCKDEIKAIEGQAIGRACRLGQKQKVKIFRVLVKDTIEEEIFNKLYK